MDLDYILHDWKTSTPPSRERAAEAAGKKQSKGRKTREEVYYPLSSPRGGASSPQSVSSAPGSDRFSENYGGADGNAWRRMPSSYHGHASTGNLNSMLADERTRLLRPSSSQSSMVLTPPVNRARGASTRYERRPNPPRHGKGESASARGGLGAGGVGSEKRDPSKSGPAATIADPIGFSRRKAPIAPAVRYMMEVMCTDLVACGECFVLDNRAGQTLVRFCGFVPIEVDEAVDGETSRFMEGYYGGHEAYGRGVGLPGIAWATARPTVVEISTLTSDASFDSGGKRCARKSRP